MLSLDNIRAIKPLPFITLRVLRVLPPGCVEFRPLLLVAVYRGVMGNDVKAFEGVMVLGYVVIWCYEYVVFGGMG